MNWNYASTEAELPAKLSKSIRLGQSIATITVSEKQDDGTYKYKQFTLSPATLDYDSICNAIISAAYPNDKMQAVINNYLLDSSDEAIVAEFNEMQDFRKQAKVWAKDILAYAKENNLWKFNDNNE